MLTVVFLIALLVPLLLSLLLTRWMLDLAPRWGIMDHPAARKVHQTVTPMGGGIAICLAFVLSMVAVAVLAWLAEHTSIAKGLPDVAKVHAGGVLASLPLLGLIIAAGVLQMLLGLTDDWRSGGLSYQLRLGFEVLLVLALMSFGVRLSLFTERIWITAPVTVLWIVGLTNAMNFLDNMDGLSAGVTAIASLLFASIALLMGNLFVAGCFLVLAGAVGGFLWFNFSPARIFMGDAGSNFLGFCLGVFTVIGTYHTQEYSHVTILAPLCILAVPIYDSTTVIALRLLQGRSPFHPDKQHFSHRLVELGFQRKNAVLLIYLVTLTTGIGGLLLFFVTPWASVLVLLQIVCLLGVVALLELASFHRQRSASSERENTVEPAP